MGQIAEERVGERDYLKPDLGGANVWVPRQSEIDRIPRERGVSYTVTFPGPEAGFGEQVKYYFHVVNDPKKFSMIHLMLTLVEVGRNRPVAFADSRLSFRGEYYDLNRYFASGCFGKRNETLPYECWSWEGCDRGVPFRDLRLGEQNPGGTLSMLVRPEYQGLQIAKSMVKTSYQVALRMGARYSVLNRYEIKAVA